MSHKVRACQRTAWFSSCLADPGRLSITDLQIALLRYKWTHRHVLHRVSTVAAPVAGQFLTNVCLPFQLNVNVINGAARLRSEEEE